VQYQVYEIPYDNAFWNNLRINVVTNDRATDVYADDVCESNSIVPKRICARVKTLHKYRNQKGRLLVFEFLTALPRTLS